MLNFRSITGLAFVSLFLSAAGQIPYQVVPLTATVSNSPPSIHIHWPQDNTAEFYKVKRRDPSQEQWEVIADLPADSDGYQDLDVQLGEKWEYAVVRSNPMYTSDTVCVTPNSNITFTIHDTGGNGLCCWNSHGYWQLFACGQLIAQGAQYGFEDQHQFTMCGSGSCDEVVVRIYPDHQFEEISWELGTDDGTVLAENAPQMAPMFGYILSGIEVPADEVQGTILILVEEEHAFGLKSEIERLQGDLIGEGWLVEVQNVPTGMGPTEVKDMVLQTHAISPDLKAVFLIGHIPVAYSGLIAPDEHEDHLGAWPADLYYAELDGPWTDEVVNWTVWNVPSRNHNIPGDGKFDQSILPSDVDLLIGRVDMYGLNVFPTSELELLRAYLDRDHAFRTGALTFARKAVIDENFSWLDHESAAFRSCIPMFGASEVYQAPFISSLSSQSHLWSMAGGPGMPDEAAGVGTSADVAATPLNGAFAHLLGSYFGDWDMQNNFMRSVLASGNILGVVWGLQEMVFHQMALGRPIGECVRRTQNARYSNYERNGGLVHMTLMGDPTLPLFPVPAVTSLTAESTFPGVHLSWNEVSGDILGYNVYRRSDPDQHFIRINDEPVVGTEFLDTDPLNGGSEYLVRALRLETSASGTFHVLGGGVVAQASFTVGLADRTNNSITIHPSPSSGTFFIQGSDLPVDATMTMWDMQGSQVSIDQQRSNDRITITTDAADGSYLLKITSGEGSQIHRSVMIAR
jgi:hypothetical protein